jgi:hypothetical protein
MFPPCRRFTEPLPKLEFARTTSPIDSVGVYQSADSPPVGQGNFALIRRSLDQSLPPFARLTHFCGFDRARTKH